MKDRQIKDHMTVVPQSLAPDQTLSEARKVMRESHIRHLPIIDQGRLRGILSQTDIQLVDALQGIDANAIEIKYAMTHAPLSVEPDATLSTVAQIMTDNKVGSVIVMKGERVLGIYTAHDAVRDLAAFLRP